MDIIDLHCDLLGYLAVDPARDPFNPAVRCSADQLKAGNVKKQVLAISSETHYLSLLFGLRQLDIFLSLPTLYPDHFSTTSILPAFENASAFALENEPLDCVFKRLDGILEKITPLYISLTWNGENRFGGGCGSNAGLKSDGKELLTYLSGKGIAIDFSHTSDPLAYAIFEEIEKRKLDLPVLASHSNFRAILDHPRNLPDPIAKEIMRRKGLIGLVLYKKFLGSPDALPKQIEHGLNLGGTDALAFGADFFYTEDLKAVITAPIGFFEEFSDASKYPQLVELLQLKNFLTKEQLEKICYKNSTKFINKYNFATK